MMLFTCLLMQDLGQQALVDMLLMCTSHPTPEIAMVPLNFWYTFCRELDRLQPRELKQRKLTAFAPSLTSLIEVLLRLMRYPEDIDQRTDDQVRARTVQYLQTLLPVALCSTLYLELSA
jgi:amino acid permease